VQEEAERENEKLKFSTTYSFLEIYNEQVTDLLEPTSRNLQVKHGQVVSRGSCEPGFYW
jgi:kinesin family protein 15